MAAAKVVLEYFERRHYVISSFLIPTPWFNDCYPLYAREIGREREHIHSPAPPPPGPCEKAAKWRITLKLWRISFPENGGSLRGFKYVTDLPINCTYRVTLNTAVLRVSPMPNLLLRYTHLPPRPCRDFPTGLHPGGERVTLPPYLFSEGFMQCGLGCDCGWNMYSIQLRGIIYRYRVPLYMYVNLLLIATENRSLWQLNNPTNVVIPFEKNSRTICFSKAGLVKSMLLRNV